MKLKGSIEKNGLVLIIAFILITLITYGIGEIIVYILAPQILYNEYNPDYPTYRQAEEYDSYLGWTPKKNYSVKTYALQGRHPLITITHNSRGFRMNHEVNTSKETIILTGDSFTYGIWADDKKIMSTLLNNFLGEEYEVINLGVEGYGIDQSLLRYLLQGSIYNPHVTIHIFFPNDFSNIASNIEYGKPKPFFVVNPKNNELFLHKISPEADTFMKLKKTTREHKYNLFERYVREHSHFYTLYKNNLPHLISFLHSPRKVPYVTPSNEGEMWSIEQNYSQIMNDSLYVNNLLILEYSKRVKKMNGEFILVILPSKLAIDKKAQKAKVVEYSNLTPDFFDWDKPYRILEAFAQQNNISVINLYPVFKKEFQENNKDMYAEDGHLNDHGHELVAQEIYKKLRELHII